MRVTIIFAVAMALTLSAFVPQEAKAERATPQETELVCQNWLAYMVYQRGGWGGDSHPTIVGVSELAEGDTVLARCFAIAPRGYVAVPILKELPPIKAYSEEYGLDVSETVGFPQLLREVLLDRIRLYAKTYGSLDAAQPSVGPVLLGRVHRQEWDRFSVSSERFDGDLRGGGFDPLTQAGPLLTTSWFQSAPYNNFCPIGFGGARCLVGCVATAAAQILKYWADSTPLDSVCITHTYVWDGDQSCGGSVGGGSLFADFSNPYDWVNMPDSCDNGCSPAENSALAELCYEVGVAFEMDYGVCGSGAFTEDALTVLPTYFGFSDSIREELRCDYNTTSWFDLIKAEINAGRPMQYRFMHTSGSGHSVVCDGWRDTDGQNQYHINYGWGGPHTDWFAIDHIDSSVNPDLNEYLIKNIFPDPSRFLHGALSGSFGAKTYHVVDTIRINPGDSLRVEPETNFYFDGPFPFLISGTLMAEGANHQFIAFDNADPVANPGLWRGLRFYPGSSGSHLVYCYIGRSAAIGTGLDCAGGGVYCDSSSPSFAHCQMDADSATAGGGVYCYYSSPTFDTCLISGNSASNGGGGVYCYYSSPTFRQCTLINNAALSGDGGGVLCYRSPAPFTNCVITLNSANPERLRQIGCGGGVLSWLSAAAFTNCLIYDNIAGLGGGVYSTEIPSPTFAHCSISYNSATNTNGGGVFCSGSSPVIKNTIVAYSQGSGIYFESSPACSVKYCDIFGSTGGNIKFYSNNPNQGPPGIGQLTAFNANRDSCDTYRNIFLNPEFVSPPSSDMHLTDSSHCLGAADSTNPPLADFEGNPRPNPSGSRPDIGAYENELARPALCGSLKGILGPGIFHVGCTIQVNAADSLRLMPGTTFMFDGHYPFTIYGKLLAEGTETDSIVFTADTLENPNRWKTLHFSGASSSSSRLAYCLIERSHGTGYWPDNTSGVYCYCSSPIFTNCSITDNNGMSVGGICCEGSSPILTNCTISRNGGLGVYCFNYSSPTFTSCAIDSNWRAGGVACFNECSPIFTNCTVSGNRGEEWGGVSSVSCSPVFANCLLNNNSAWSEVIVCYHDSSSFWNCTISGNSGNDLGAVTCMSSSASLINTIIAFSNGPGITFVNDGGEYGTIIANCDIFGNSGGNFQFYENDSSSGPVAIGQLNGINANGDSCDSYANIFVDPLFADTATSDFHLTDYSPCIGGGTSMEWPWYDFEGESRPNPWDSYPDIGMDEHWLAGPVRHLVITITMEEGCAVLRWPSFARSYKIYGATTPFSEGTLLGWTEETVWADGDISSRPSPYFYYVRAVQEDR